MKTNRFQKWFSVVAVLPCVGGGPLAQADQQILDDLIVDGSICVGQDCVNGESFGFDTIRLKENNLRIRFVDTSNSSSFPTRDWQITINDSSNGGQNKFAIEDIDGAKTPFTIEGNAPSHSLYVDDGGRLGLGTSTPVVDVHVKSGNTPTLRLEQDGTSGFGPQTWDVAGNEANFFIRDASNGSTLPFRLFPGAPSNSIAIAASGNVGIGTTSPASKLNVDTNDALGLQVNGDGIKLIDLKSDNGNPVQFRFVTDSTNRRIVARDTANTVTRSQLEFGDGELTFYGELFSDLFATVNSNGIELPSGAAFSVNGMNLNVPDYVFKESYHLMPLTELESFISINKHLPGVPSASEIGDKGLNMTEMQMSLLKKIEELTLYTLEQQNSIERLALKLAKLESME